jgi:hypothetical protein
LQEQLNNCKEKLQEQYKINEEKNSLFKKAQKNAQRQVEKLKVAQGENDKLLKVIEALKKTIKEKLQVILALNGVKAQRDQLVGELASEKDHSQSLLKELQEVRRNLNVCMEDLRKQAEFQRARVSQGSLGEGLQKPENEDTEDQEETLDLLNQ